MCSVEKCQQIATVAHTACGQKRADKVTPYIVHPARVAELTKEFFDLVYYKSNAEGYWVAVKAAWLHDVLEDTKLTAQNLRDLGVCDATIEIVKLLTKENAPEEAESQEYYARIAKNDLAKIVKCADRCANLEDSIKELQRSSTTHERWKRYAARTRDHVLPIYESMPILHDTLGMYVEDVANIIHDRVIAEQEEQEQRLAQFTKEQQEIFRMYPIWRIYADQTWGVIQEMTYAKGRMLTGHGDPTFIIGTFCYETMDLAKKALKRWDGTGEPGGWFRSVLDGRRRPNGDPTREHFQE